MKNTLSLVLFCSIFCYACSKSSSNQKPSIKIKTLSGTTIPYGGTLSIDFTYQEGGSALDSFLIYKVRTNKHTVATTLRDSLRVLVPDHEGHTSGDLQVDLTYQNYLISAQTPPISGTPPTYEPDSLIFKFVVKDKAKLVSDTVYTPVIAVIR
jgi:hypothetical protein